MVIINSNDTDQITNDIIDWLIFFDVNFKRINVSDYLVVKNLAINNEVNFELIFVDTGEIIKSKEITFYWYRRGGLNIYLKPDPELDDSFVDEQDKLKQFELTNAKPFKPGISTLITAKSTTFSNVLISLMSIQGQHEFALNLDLTS